MDRAYRVLFPGGDSARRRAHGGEHRSQFDRHECREAFLRDRLPGAVLNDADAAGLAEMRFGAGQGVDGVVLIVTIGTGLGTALFTDGILVPNTESGHIEMNGGDAEVQASDAAHKRDSFRGSSGPDASTSTCER